MNDVPIIMKSAKRGHRLTFELSDMDKDKVGPITCHEGTEGEWRFSSTRSLTLALDGGG